MSFRQQFGDFWKGRQSAEYESIGVLYSSDNAKSHTLRFHWKLDSYEEQSYAKVERWSGKKWQTVYYLEGRRMPVWELRAGKVSGPRTPTNLSTQTELQDYINVDLKFLMERAKEILL